MKKIIILLVFSFLTCRNFVSAQIISPDQVGLPAKNFISVYFPETEIQSVEFFENGYIVFLSDFTSLFFDADFDINSIDCSESTTYYAVPDNIFHPDILKYIRENYKKCWIVSLVYQNNNTRKATLNNGKSIIFKGNKILSASK